MPQDCLSAGITLDIGPPRSRRHGRFRGREVSGSRTQSESEPGESLTTPMAFVGLFQGDLDEAGNEVLDWQYRYLWTTRARMASRDSTGGLVVKGTGWPDLRNTRWIGQEPLTLTLLDADNGSTYRRFSARGGLHQ